MAPSCPRSLHHFSLNGVPDPTSTWWESLAPDEELKRMDVVPGGRTAMCCGWMLMSALCSS
eukprot:CAMPEP_0179324122 /NCGR_PEP_ID=MMETSP0797-20121207/60104_1 /TAXON_ID=47934 /ORGANISM="Dinophysis acuminata, Strain DAEP01" /LENGTH=60 /DNA_ID=CAMNT_0021036047 /DNA_START=86 /DNA_END=265 /DNA_ORIENTATION=+